MKSDQEFKYRIEDSLHAFLIWLKDFGFLSYDQFDFWATDLGVSAKKLYMKNKWVAAPFVLSLQLLESFLPAARILFARKRRFAIGDAHFALGFMNLYLYRNEANDLEMAKTLLQELEKTATQTQSGIGWGYPYTWVTGRAVYMPGTPFITVTPYCAEAFLKMYEITGETRHLDTFAQIARFAAYDLNETVITPQAVAAGYGPGDQSRVINANTYRAALLLKAFQAFGINEYKEKALQNIRFVLNSQEPDGSWLYAHNEPFIDNFHTCFVLKNLYKSFLILQDESILESIKKGYNYYRKYLFRSDLTPIHFSKASHSKFRKLEMYDYAEGIALGVLLNPHIEGALDFSLQLANHLLAHYQLTDGHFVTRVTTFNTWNKTPYLRWPQAQLFHALTMLLGTKELHGKA